VDLLPEVPSPFTVTRLATYHDDCQGTQRGENTIHILDDGRTRLAHFGDLGCPLTPDQLVALRDLDVALIPVGGFYTIDPRQAAALAEQVKPRVTVPMHFRDDEAGFGFDVISTVEEFASLLSPTVFLEGSLLDTEDLPDAAAAVLRPRYGR
jgi:L-ascorbate metabolism protein UlaG (beta-lactamase superfamily)